MYKNTLKKKLYFKNYDKIKKNLYLKGARLTAL